MSFDSGIFNVTAVLKAQPFLRFILLFGSYNFLLLLRLLELVLRLFVLLPEDGLVQRPCLHIVVVKVDRLGMQERVRVHLGLLY